MNSVNLIGRLVKDIEMKSTSTGKSVCNFSIAVQRDKENADFIPCTAWEATAVNIGKYFHKGDLIGITGVLSTRTYEDSNGQNRFVMEVLVNRFDFINSKKTEHEQPQTQHTANEGYRGLDEQAVSEAIANSDMPFEI